MSTTPERAPRTGFWTWLARRRAAKCERVGHRQRIERRSGYRRAEPGAFRTVAYRVSEECVECRRCGAELEPWTETDRQWLSGLSLPSEDMQRLRAEGVLWI